MTTRFGLELRIAAVLLPWLGAILVAVSRKQPRKIAFAVAVLSCAASLLLLRAAPASESLDEVVMALYSLVGLAATVIIPRRDCTPAIMSGMLMVLGSTLLAYSADNLLVFFAAWALTTVPFFVPGLLGTITLRPRIALLASSVALGAAIAVAAAAGHGLSISALKGQGPGGTPVFALLVAAVICRKGIWPAHAWVADAVEHGPAVPTALFLNGHLGAYLVAKVLMPLFPRSPHNSVALLSYLALGTALFVAIRALTENAPRRLLGFVALSQSACILAGLESQTTEGMTGALVHWCVVTVSTVGLFGILRLLEVRFGENVTASRHFGLAENAPRLAVYFLVFGLALVGLPGTLSFCSQDLLIHGTLASHTHTGLLLPIATALNAISIFRLFTRLFLGRRRTGFTIMADALPRERWILAAGLVFVVLGGLFPNAIVSLQTAEAETVARAIAASASTTAD
jgi:NADH-quinone oxidoreductase subunit M